MAAPPAQPALLYRTRRIALARLWRAYTVRPNGGPNGWDIGWRGRVLPFQPVQILNLETVFPLACTRLQMAGLAMVTCFLSRRGEYIYLTVVVKRAT